MFTIEASTEILSRTPAVLDAWLRGLAPAWCDASEGPGRWTPREVLAHLLQGEEEDWVPRARIILAGDPSRTFTPFEREKFRTLYPGLSVEDLLDRFRAKRRENLKALEGMRLDAGKLAMEGTHPAFGPVTMRQLLATWVVHDLGHLRQVARVMAKRYVGDVGPWREYLPVLGE